MHVRILHMSQREILACRRVDGFVAASVYRAEAVLVARSAAIADRNVFHRRCRRRRVRSLAQVGPNLTNFVRTAYLAHFFATLGTRRGSMFQQFVEHGSEGRDEWGCCASRRHRLRGGMLPEIYTNLEKCGRPECHRAPDSLDSHRLAPALQKA